MELNWDAVYSAYKQAERRYQSRLAAQHQIELINKQEVVGTANLTPPFVQVKLQALERSLATAPKREEALALANYNIAIEKLQKSEGHSPPLRLTSYPCRKTRLFHGIMGIGGGKVSVVSGCCRSCQLSVVNCTFRPPSKKG